MSERPSRPRLNHFGLVAAACVVVAAGFAVPLVKMYRLHDAFIWIVVGTAVLLIALIRTLTARK